MTDAKQLDQKLAHLRALYMKANPAPMNPAALTPKSLFDGIMWLASRVLKAEANGLIGNLEHMATQREGYAPEEHQQHFIAELDRVIAEIMSAVQKMEHAAAPMIKTFKKVPRKIIEMPGSGRAM